MHWRGISGVAHVAVHTESDPSDEDWNAYVDDASRYASDIKGLLVYSTKVGPSASQRSHSSEVLNRLAPNLRVAIMTGSRMTQGIVTAVSWVIGDKIKAFSTRDFNGAATFLDLDHEEQLRVRVIFKQLARSAGVEIDAFADESGQFRKRYRD